MIHNAILIFALLTSIFLLLFGYKVIEIEKNLNLSDSDYDKIIISGYTDLSLCLVVLLYKCCFTVDNNNEIN